MKILSTWNLVFCQFDIKCIVNKRASHVKAEDRMEWFFVMHKSESV
jgi:hypothetical protein